MEMEMELVSKSDLGILLLTQKLFYCLTVFRLKL